MLERRNTVNGRAYKDDPTILGFDLLNELRCSSYEARLGRRAGRKRGTAAPQRACALRQADRSLHLLIASCLSSLQAPLTAALRVSPATTDLSCRPAGAGVHRLGDEMGAGDGTVSGTQHCTPPPRPNATWLLLAACLPPWPPLSQRLEAPTTRQQAAPYCRHFKSLDQRHLLTLGSEGFWGERDAMRSLNPGMPVSGEGLPLVGERLGSWGPPSDRGGGDGGAGPAVACHRKGSCTCALQCCRAMLCGMPPPGSRLSGPPHAPFLADWASKAGQDWIANHALPQIDFASFHIWSDNWGK